MNESAFGTMPKENLPKWNGRAYLDAPHFRLSGTYTQNYNYFIEMKPKSERTQQDCANPT